MDDSSLDDIARQLSDLEVALFLCLAAREHCLIETTSDGINDLGKELALICSQTFGLSYSIVDFDSTTTIEEIHNDILTVDARKSQERPLYSRRKTGSSSSVSAYLSLQDRSKSPIPSLAPDEINVVNVIIAKNFNLVNDDLQVQALHLMRTRKLAIEMKILNAPADFMFLPLVARDSDQLQPLLKAHLNDNLLVSYFHDPMDGYMYLEESDWLSDGQLSASSVIHKPKHAEKITAKVNQTMIEKLREETDAVTTSAEVARYIQDIIVFLRLSRAVAGGISAKANIQFSRLAKLLAPLHGMDYLTPSIVSLAARKVFRHRIIVASPDDDRSLQYGSDLAAVSHILVDITPDSILDGVLALEPPI
ncbi:hypothetical protein N7495_005929 [Penicillium taxi]|uniref:uncharacterized protein n=1 Tax=Penicillium taxi TaxID=168475 RepID=UPI002545BA6B|nr:uncharacterized protein N7495_005929 [Penicillium taxi]KAJ5894238.1 hypothetical protein N7495_005929 [Penicillium taxi]